MNRNTLLGTALVGGVAAIVAFGIYHVHGQTDAADGRRTDELQDDELEGVLNTVEGLSGEVRRLKLRLDRNDAARALSTLSVAAAPETGARPSDAPEESSAAPEMSASDLHENRVHTYTRRFNEEPREASAAAAFEEAITSVVDASGHSSMESVECRTSMCRLEIRHNDPSGRERFIDFMFGPLRFGAYDYLSEDGDKTIAFVGMPNHTLPKIDSDELAAVPSPRSLP